jgi:hypothetical protein
MSLVTDIVFITPFHEGGKERFQEIFLEKYTHLKGYRPPYQEDSGPKVTGLAVFHLGVNYADAELIEALRNEKFPDGSVLYVDEFELRGSLWMKAWGEMEVRQ